MYVILGSTGHIGSALTALLLERGEAVTAVTRDWKKADEWRRRGAEAAAVDVNDTAALRDVLRRGKRAFLLNPPADPSTDTVVEERRTAASILAALDGSGLEKVVAESTYGAQPGNRIGDLGVLYEMEQALGAQTVPSSVIRGAYYMSNWDHALATARDEGKVYSLYPADFRLPMVAPADIAALAARLLTEPADETRTAAIEGPTTYAIADVAAAFSEALHRPVEVVTIERDRWAPWLIEAGFSPAAADSMAAMTALTLDERGPRPERPERGSTSLDTYILRLVKSAPSA